MIRKATYSDIDKILIICSVCAKHMVKKGIHQWNDYYPNRNAFENDLKRDELYVIELNNIVIGCIAISSLMDSEYEPIKWLTQNTDNVYIHRLTVHPREQGQGYAQQLMYFAENYAIKNNYSSIRLDTFSMNKRNQKFYELRNYKRLGNVYFPKQSEDPFYCYELVL